MMGESQACVGDCGKRGLLFKPKVKELGWLGVVWCWWWSSPPSAFVMVPYAEAKIFSFRPKIYKRPYAPHERHLALLDARTHTVAYTRIMPYTWTCLY